MLTTLKKSRLFAALMLAFLTLASFKSFAQEKRLQTESDGFQWYELYKDGKYGAQSMGGVTFIPLSRGYTRIYYQCGYGGRFKVEKGDEKCGFCDLTGREIIAPGKYDEASYTPLSEDFGYYPVKLNGKPGVCYRNGQEIIAPGRYDNAFCWDDDVYVYCIVKLNGKYGICDMNGQEIIAPRYKNLKLFSGVFKYEDKSGKWVSTGIKVSSLAQTPTSTPSPAPMPTPTPTPQPQPQPQPEPQPRQPQPFQVWKTCFMCGGSGQCPYCYGYGWAANGKDVCGICHGTGKCSQCAGHGGHNEIEYH